MFRVFTTKEFDDDFNKLDESDKKIVRKTMDQLKEQGADVGKSLKAPYFREKRIRDKRLYFLVYKDFMVILGVAIGDKKLQQTTIDKTILKLNEYRDLVIKKLREL
jgi:mRNA-degrading endonuclease RelE of RelBE toxin-antitoxin system